MERAGAGDEGLAFVLRHGDQRRARPRPVGIGERESFGESLRAGIAFAMPDFSAATAQAASLSLWHWPQALGVPSATVRSGRGMRIE